MAFGIGIGGFGGQSLCLVALAQKVQGCIAFIVFPIATGDNLFLVAAARILLFSERIGRF